MPAAALAEGTSYRTVICPLHSDVHVDFIFSVVASPNPLFKLDFVALRILERQVKNVLQATRLTEKIVQNARPQYDLVVIQNRARHKPQGIKVATTEQTVTT